MAELNIPTEVKDIKAFPQLRKIDRQIVCAALLMGLPNQEAFLLFHPEFLDSRGKMNDAGKKASSMFWNYGKNKDYREQYEKEVAEFLGRKQTARSELSDIDDIRKDKALKALLNRAMSLVEDNTELDPDTLKTLTEIFKKTGLLKDEVEEQEKPRRYLPVRCLSECAYRLFVESHIESGDIISECDYCRTRKFAEERGWKFDSTKNLDLPIKNEDTNE